MPHLLQWKRRIDQTIDHALNIAGAIAGLAVAALMLNIVADSAMRFIFNSPIRGTLDYAQAWWMITIGFGAMGLAEKRNEHIEANILFVIITKNAQNVWRYLSIMVTGALLAMMVWYGYIAAETNRQRGEYSGGSGIAIWPMRYWVPIGSALFLLAVISETNRRSRPSS